jgi:copper ion binding protein
MTTTTITVQGMTCGHCVAAVEEELGRLDGVTSVDVDLDSGAVSVTSVGALRPDLLAAAVDEAGYAIADE